MMRKTFSRLAPAGLALGLLGAAASPAFAAPAPADAPIATDPKAADPTGKQIEDWIASDAAAPESLTGGPIPPDLLPPERRIHGEVGANVGNRGYGGYAAVQVPFGEASEVDMAVAGQHFNGYGPWRGGNSKSLALAVVLDGGDIARLISRDKCNVPRWGVKLKHDPVVLPDGRCIRPEEETADAAPSARGRSGGAGNLGGFGP